MNRNDPIIGQMVSRYRIREKIGEGGMGVLYKAEDIRLNRFVAVKFLRPEFTLNEEAKIRFTREARSASSLDHPNICTVHEIDETEDGRMFIAMAYYDGETLKAKLERIPLKPTSQGDVQGIPVSRGCLKTDESIQILVQIAHGLEAAHEAGIIHRDVKPSNIIVTNKGDVKIVDFGMVKLAGDMNRTVTGTTLGTVEYMSPEQAQGFDVDKRSDIWSLGVMTYEMTTGRLPFRGDRPLAVIHSIINEQPESILKKNPILSPGFDSVVSCALGKKAEDRYPSMRQMAEDLTALKQDSDQRNDARLPLYSDAYAKQRARQAIRRKVMVGLCLMGAAVLLTAAVVGLGRMFRKPIPETKVVPFTNLDGMACNPAFSPDGNTIAFNWLQPDSTRSYIYTKSLGGDRLVRITRPPGSFYDPVWSPDGSQIAFFRFHEAQWTLNSMPATGGAVSLLRVLSPKWKLLINRLPFGDWSPDGTVFVYTDFDGVQDHPSLFLHSFQNGQTRRITTPPPETLGDWSPKFSSDGKSICFTRHTSVDVGELYIVSPEGGTETRITFDNRSLYGQAWTADGREIVFSSSRNTKSVLWSVPIHGGEPKPLLPGVRNAGNVTISRDGRKLAFDEWTGRWKNWRYDTRGSEEPGGWGQSILPLGHSGRTAVFSPDGARIAYFSDRFGFGELWVARSDGTDPVRLTDLGNVVSDTPRWSPDGGRIAFDSRPRGNSDIFIVDAQGGPLKPVTDSPSDDRNPSWSRDGNWIYFSSNRSGTFQMWKQPVKGGNAVQVTTEGGINGFESFDVRWLYFNEARTTSEASMPSHGIWRISSDGGGKQRVLDSSIGYFNWTLAENGIFFIQHSTGSGSKLEFLDFQSGRITPVAGLSQNSIRGLSVSSDRRSFLVSEVEITADIILVENFR
jgi:serine/threonine protein kinase/dipeptidyl aminopeptidase/acylaminoacyl peptidase